jgi:excisionase family DNA binding protein
MDGPMRAQGVPVGVEFPAEAVEAIATRAAELVLEQFALNGGSEWPAWMSVERAAAYLDVSPERVRKLISTRSIPYSQEGPGCRVFLQRSALDEWMLGMSRRPR